MAFDAIRRELRALKASEPGTRFEGAHERHRVDSRTARLVLIGVGVAIAFAGAVTFWLPGPNFVLVLAGLALVAAQWGAVASRLDRLEVFGRGWRDERWEPYPHKRAVIVGTVLVVLALLAGAGWLAYENEWLPGWLARRLP